MIAHRARFMALMRYLYRFSSSMSYRTGRYDNPSYFKHFPRKIHPSLWPVSSQPELCSTQNLFNLRSLCLCLTGFALVQEFLNIVEPLIPETLVLGDQMLQLSKLIRFQGIDPLLGLDLDRYEVRFPQNTEMPRNPRLRYAFEE